MAELVIHLTIQIDTALSVGAGGSSGVLADKAIVRTQLGELLLPGSQLKGRLRHACEMLAHTAQIPICRSPRPEQMCPHAPTIPAPCPICQIFGSPGYAGALTFSDLVYTDLAGGDAIRPPSIRPGVSINRRRGTAEDQRLFYTETSPPGGLIHFDRADAIYGHLPDDRPKQEIVALTQLLLAGIAFVQNWGGGKSRGLGWGRTIAHARLNDQPIVLNDLPGAMRQLGGIEVTNG
jgi:CRISPR/Cas system CSM-associated protein Csm3 (group 7 of RAMP superfamily)